MAQYFDRFAQPLHKIDEMEDDFIDYEGVDEDLDKIHTKYQNLALVMKLNPEFDDMFHGQLVEGLMSGYYTLHRDMEYDLNRTDMSDPEQLIRQYNILAHIDYIDEIITKREPIAERIRAIECVTSRHLGIKGHHCKYDLIVDEHKLYEGEAVLLIQSDRLEAKNPFKVYHGVISRYMFDASKTSGVYIAVAENDDMRYPNAFGKIVMTKDFDIYRKPNSLAFDTAMTVLNHINQKDELSRKMLGPVPTQRELGEPARRISWRIPTLNRSQLQAANLIANMNGRRVVVLNGPPGTGKTYTLVHTILAILDEFPDTRFLILTPSNQAADSIANTFLDNNFNNPEKIIRMVSRLINPATRPDRLNKISPLHDGTYTTLSRSGLAWGDVVISTIGHSWILYKDIPRGGIDYIIIDEGGQAPEYLTFAPIALFCSNDTKVVVAGDPLQLGPVIMNEVLYRDHYEYVEVTMLKRLAEEYYNRPDLMVTLRTNYRSHPDIAEIPSQVYYGGVYQAAETPLWKSLERSPVLNHQITPIRYISVEGEEEKSNDPSMLNSIFNMAEVYQIINYIHLIKRHHPDIEESEIGIIAPYRAQVQHLRQALQQFPGITISTVFKYQGSERRVILVSTVRTKALGFLSDFRLMNTAITRARHMLLIFGHRHLWNLDPRLRGLVSELYRRGLCYDAYGSPWTQL